MNHVYDEGHMAPRGRSAAVQGHVSEDGFCVFLQSESIEMLLACRATLAMGSAQWEPAGLVLV